MTCLIVLHVEQVERRQLKHAAAEAQQRLRQAEAASQAAEAACSATQSQKTAIAEALSDARYDAPLY